MAREAMWLVAICVLSVAVTATAAGLDETTTIRRLQDVDTRAADSALLGGKVAAVFVTSVLAMCAGLLPVLWGRFRQNLKALGMANSFTGGIFLCMGLMHLLPESVEIFDAQTERVGDYPFPFLLVFVGYTFILIVEKIAFDSHSLLAHSDYHFHDARGAITGTLVTAHHEASQGRQLAAPLLDETQEPLEACVDGEHNEEAVKTILSSRTRLMERYGEAGGPSLRASGMSSIELASLHESALELDGLHADGSVAELSHMSTQVRAKNTTSVLPKPTDSPSKSVHTHSRPVRSSSSDADWSNYDEWDHQDKAAQSPLLKSSSSAAATSTNHVHDSHHHGHTLDSNHSHEPSHELTRGSNLLTPMLLLLALSIHSVFEGIALGLQRTEDQLYTLLFAVVSHKWAEALALGVSLGKAGAPRRRSMLLIAIFSVATPVGICIGFVISATHDPLVEAVFLSLATGTFLYVGASEIVVEEFSVSKHKWLKFLFYALGGLFVSLLALIDDPDRS